MALTAFVLGGGGMLGAAEVGMLQALSAHGVMAELVVGTSVGAINGAAYACEPATAADRLAQLWTALGSSDIFAGGLIARLRTLARSRTHLYGNEHLHALLSTHLPARRFEDLAVPFHTVAACIERAAAHWFDSGPLLEAVLAGCAVPGLLPPVRIDGEHFLDGGLVDSLPVGRAITLGATEIYALHVGRLEQPLTAPAWPWDVATVAFEIARRSRFTDAMAALPDGVRVHVLPTGAEPTPLVDLRLRSTRGISRRIELARVATTAYLQAQ